MIVLPRHWYAAIEEGSQPLAPEISLSGRSTSDQRDQDELYGTVVMRCVKARVIRQGRFRPDRHGKLVCQTADWLDPAPMC
jgi:hypothetical protein